MEELSSEGRKIVDDLARLVNGFGIPDVELSTSLRGSTESADLEVAAGANVISQAEKFAKLDLNCG